MDRVHPIEAAASTSPLTTSPPSTSPRCVAITGVNTPLGLRLVERLAAWEKAPDLVVLDRREPLGLPAGVRFERVDLTQPIVDGRLAEVLATARVETIVHLAFRNEPTRDIEADHELETIGSLHLLQAASDAGIRRLILASSTMLYGPRAENPTYLSESHPLHGHPDAHCVQNRVEVERMVEQWSRQRADHEVCVLRGCWVVGPNTRDHVSRYLTRATVPIVLGYDPLMQLIHEDDWLYAFERAIAEGPCGVFNLVGTGVVPISRLLRSAGRRVLALPFPVLERSAAWLGSPAAGDAPAGFYDYLRYLWVADGGLGWSTFGEPFYSTQEAWASLVSVRSFRRSA